MADHVAAGLAGLGIREIEADIFTMSGAELRARFAFANGNLHTSRLIRNLIWQDYRRLQRGQLGLFYGNIRSYWYARVKPVLARARARRAADKYDMMIGQLVRLVVERRLFDYAEFGFTDEGAGNRSLGGANGHVVLVAEKLGHLPLLKQIQRDFDVTIVALGGQPSALSTEYLLGELRAAGLTKRAQLPLVTIVDYDPAGDSIANRFIWQMRAHGLGAELVRVDLVHPDRMTDEQVRLNRYRLLDDRSQRKRNRRWVAKTGGLRSRGLGVFYGVEADAMPWSELVVAFERAVAHLLDVEPTNVARRRLERETADTLTDLLLARLPR